MAEHINRVVNHWPYSVQGRKVICWTRPRSHSSLFFHPKTLLFACLARICWSPQTWLTLIPLPPPPRGDSNCCCYTRQFLCFLPRIEAEKSSEEQFVIQSDDAEVGHRLWEGRCIEDRTTPGQRELAEHSGTSEEAISCHLPNKYQRQMRKLRLHGAVLCTWPYEWWRYMAEGLICR